MNKERESFRDLTLNLPFKMYSAPNKDAETLLLIKILPAHRTSASSTFEFSLLRTRIN